MKKITKLFILFILLLVLNSCRGFWGHSLVIDNVRVQITGFFQDPALNTQCGEKDIVIELCDTSNGVLNPPIIGGALRDYRLIIKAAYRLLESNYVLTSKNIDDKGHKYHLGNIDLVNDLLKESDYKYANLTHKDRAAIIRLIVRIEEKHFNGKTDVYDNSSDKWKILHFLCTHFHDNKLLDSLLIANVDEETFYSKNHTRDRSFRLDCAGSIAKPKHFSRLFLSLAEKPPPPNTFWVVWDEGVCQMKTKLIFEYQFLNIDGILQLSKKLLNIEDVVWCESNGNYREGNEE